MPAGYRLPSTRVLSAQIGVARNTVLEAYEQLRSEGYVESRQGSGHYVAEFVPESFERLTAKRHRPEATRGATAQVANRFAFVPESFRRAIPAVPFRANLPALDGDQLQAWIRLYTKVLRHAGRSARDPGHFGETDAIGDGLLRRAIAEHVALARGVRCSPEQVVITAGAQHAMDLLLRVLGSPGEKVWIEDPCFPGALAALRGAGLEPVPIAVDEDGIDVDRARRLAARARLAIVCPSKQFPLGHVMALHRRLALIEWARGHGAWIIEDDYDSEYRFSGKTIPSLQGLDGGEFVVYVGTFSKVLFPGLRLGFIVAPPMLVDPIVGVRTLAGRHGNPLDQQVLARFILEGHLGRHVRRMRKLYQGRMEALRFSARRWLDGAVTIEPAEAGLQTIGWLRAGFDDQSVSEQAAEAGVEVGHLSRYCIETARPPGLVFGFGAFDEREIDAAARVLASVFEREAGGRGARTAKTGSRGTGASGAR
jgi:GntR family transcriptional regulator / MocR family aminotransferase